MRYYELQDNLCDPEDRWFLKSLNLVDENKVSVWEFVMTNKINIEPLGKLKMSIRENGTPLDFTFADFSVIIVNEKVAFLLNEEECQLIPVEIEGLKNKHTYFIVVLLNSVDCVDENRSNFEKYEADDPIRPDKAGHYKSIYELHVNKNNINGNSIFRIDKYGVDIIINEDLKNKFEKLGVTGVKFKDVT